MVMNLVAICLVATSLAAAGVWSPPPATGKQNDVVVKEGHRVVVVEYDQDGHRNTKVSISPDHDRYVSSSSAAKDAVTDAAKEAAGEVGRKGSVSKELICDAYGKCKHVVSSTLGRAKDKAEDVTETVKERAKEKFEDVREGVEEVGESAARKARDVKERAKGTFEDAKDRASSMKERAEETVGKAKTRTTEAVRSASEAVESVGEQAAKKAKEAKETTKDTAKSTVQWLKDLGRQVVESQMMTNSVPGLINMLGFATAYGMCMWVTFISSYVLAGSLPRQQFAVVQSKIYPVYFRAMAYSIGTALLGHLLSQRKRLFNDKSEMLQGLNLASSLSMVFFNMIFLEPRATKVMFERMKLEKEEGRGRDLFGGGPLTGSVTVPTGAATTEAAADAAPTTTTATVTTTRDKTTEEEGVVLRDVVTKLNNRLKSLNAYSSMLNILTLMGLTWHLLYQNQRLSGATTSC